MLELFAKYNIHATWSTIGFLFFNNLIQLQKNYPKKVPKYKNKEIDLYNYADKNPDMTVSYHFAPKLIRLIKESKNQEISTHTFSHYYTLESGQTKEEFYEDLLSAKKIAKELGININSIVFPRNQYNKSYLDIVKQLGISSYRGNENGWIYKAADEKDKKTIIKRVLRIIDSYINISGHHTYKLSDLNKGQPFNITASRFLRPYIKELSFFDKLKLQRIKRSMTYAAKNGELFHLWWHPHNFGKDTEKNITFLTKILDHYLILKHKYNFQSLNMNEISNLLK
jgi:peptidoglycan/xylan/chitin deacetylase (PgdA/CDA1 family)